jgi:hypothetical protein
MARYLAAVAILLLMHPAHVQVEPRNEGVRARGHRGIVVYEGFAHADYYLEGTADTPEARQHHGELDAFLSRHLAGPLSAHPAGGRALR